MPRANPWDTTFPPSPTASVPCARTAVACIEVALALFAFVVATAAAGEDAGLAAPDWSMVGYGDSLTRDDELTGKKWCGPRIEPPRFCEPRGVSGETAADGVARLLRDLEDGLISPEFDYVVLGWGANDLRRGAWDPDEQIFDPLARAADELVEAGFVPVFWVPNPQFEIPTPPFVIEQRVESRLWERVVPGVWALSASYPGAPVLDLYGELWALGEEEMAELYWDHVHLDFDGQQLLAEIVQGVVDAHYGQVPEADLLPAVCVALATLGVVRRRATPGFRSGGGRAPRGRGP